MLTPELNKYKETYNQMIILLTEYHNRHQEFLNNVSYAGGVDLRRTMKKIIAADRELMKGTKAVHDEMIKNLKDMRRAKREKNREVKKKKLNDMALSKSSGGDSS
jgi:hypothetical protein